MVRTPFFVINPKSYLFGNEIEKLALKAEELSIQYDVDILFTAPLIDLPYIKEIAPSLFLTSQHLDGIEIGRGMGHVLPEALANRGVKATFLNHAEFPLTLEKLDKSIKRAKENKIITIVCAGSYEEIKAVASFSPDIMVCEPTELIGTGKTSDDAYMVNSRNIIKKISPDTKVLQAAGISSGKDVYRAFKNGAEGTGGTSGIVCAKDPMSMLDEMIEALDMARKEVFK